MTKGEFLAAWGFPREWASSGLYPDELYAMQRDASDPNTADDPSEHVRHGAFLWWTRGHRDLSPERLIVLSRLAALDPDPAMSGAAIREILFHPNADEAVADCIAELASRHDGWSTWRDTPDAQALFRRVLEEGRAAWRDRQAAHRIARDLDAGQLEEAELRSLYALGSPVVLKGLAEHPGLPVDLLRELAQLESVRYAREIRTIAAQRLAGQTIAPTGYAATYSTDPWSWRR